MNLLIFLFHRELAETCAAYLEARKARVDIRVASTREEALEHAAWADIVVSFGAEVKSDFFHHAARLKWVQSFGTGTDGISDNPHLAKDVLVTATRGIHGAPMSELAILMMLAFSRDMRRMERQRAEKKWERWAGRTLGGKTVGILGLGTIAQDMAPRLKALGMTVIGISRERRPVAGFDEVYSRSEMLEAVEALDYLVLLLPLDDESRNIVNAKVLGAMKSSAFLINLARGGVLDEGALIAALDSKSIAGAAIDAFSEEPLPPDNPLWDRPEVFITPHIGGYYDDYARDAAMQFEHNLSHFLAGDIENMAYPVRRV